MSQESPVLQRIFFVLLVGLLVGSLSLFIVNSLIYRPDVWELYSRAFHFIILGFAWYIFILLFIGDVKKKHNQIYAGEKISVVIPCYNEVPKLLRRSLESVIAAEGNKEIIVIDDGSMNGVHWVAQALSWRHGITVHRFSKNQGKRHALHYAVTKLISADSQFVVTIDSDTVLDESGLIRLVEPLKDPKIGAASGDVRLLNENQNWLTRMASSYYWVALNIDRKAQSAAGIVACCSGCMAGYKTSVISSVIDRFVNQKFFGERCTHSEDRHLTNLVHQKGYKVVFVPEAISYTETPSTLRGFLKQQQRWLRGFMRESLYALSFAWRNKPLLFFQILLWDLTLPFLGFGLTLMLIVTVIFNPQAFLFAILPSWILFMLVRYMPMLFFEGKKLRGLLYYMIFFHFFTYWQNVYALFTFKNKSWITR